jgi:hypothetical protein
MQALAQAVESSMSSALTAMSNTIAGLFKLNTAIGTTAADGTAVITHGLGFKPSYVFAQSTDDAFGLHSALAIAVTARTTTTFTVTLLASAGDGSGHLLPFFAARQYSIAWLAFP